MELKPNRGISGVYLKFKNPETGNFENRCFEDLPEEEQDRWMNSLDIDALKRLIKVLANVINEIQ
jgi:hypothetical protein